MARAIRPVGHEEHLSLVEHLDELRSRIIVSLVVVAVAFGVCFWQHNALLSLLNRPLSSELSHQIAKGQSTQGQIGTAWTGIRSVGADTRAMFSILLDPASGVALTPAARAALERRLARLNRDIAQVPKNPPKDVPTTLGIAEPFTATVTVSFYFALLASLPLLLFEFYGFVIPAFSPRERAVALPVLLAAPGLFAGGVLFGYFVVLPAAVHFLQTFTTSSFNQLVQATSYYSFAALMLLAMGVIFQVPLVVVAVARAGIVTPRQLRHNRRYAIVIAAAIAALLPGDVVTMALEAVPIVVLYEVGILISAALERRDARRARAAMPATPTSAPPPPIPFDDAL